MRGLTVKRSWMTGLVVALLVLGGSPAVASPPGGPPRPGHPVHLVIGDSVPAGQQSVPPAVDFPTTAALWKANGFVAQYHRVLRDELDCSPGRPHHRPGRSCHALGLVNLSRTGIPGVAAGVTTATVLQPGDQLDQAVALIEEHNGNRSPRDDVKVITVSIGGNDIYGPAIAGVRPADQLLRPRARCDLRRLRGPVRRDPRDPAGVGRSRHGHPRDDLLQPAAVLRPRRGEPGHRPGPRRLHPRGRRHRPRCHAAGLQRPASRGRGPVRRDRGRHLRDARTRGTSSGARTACTRTATATARSRACSQRPSRTDARRSDGHVGRAGVHDAASVGP